MSNQRPPSDARQKFEDLSRGPLNAMNRMPRAVVIIGIAALLVAGMLTPPMIGFVLLLILALFLAWLLALSWPGLDGGSRAMRVVTVALVLGAAFLRMTGRG